MQGEGGITLRSAEKLNSFSQEFKSLEAGRTYAFRVITGEYQDFPKEEKHAVSVKLVWNVSSQ